MELDRYFKNAKVSHEISFDDIQIGAEAINVLKLRLMAENTALITGVKELE